MTGYPSGITEVSPADGQALDQSPQAITIAFDPADIDTLAQFISNLFGGDTPIPTDQVLSSFLSNADVQLLAVNRDGSTSPVFDFGQYALQEQLDSTGTALTIPLQLQNVFSGDPVNVTLSPGTYQIALEGNTGLSTAISESYLPDQQPLWDPTESLVVSTFTVLGTGTTFADASPLPIGPSTQTYTSSLNPDDYRSAVDLFKFTLAPGQLWQVGVSISTRNIDSPLLTTLTLFDSNGNVLATSTAGSGLPDDPSDPYLFAGLRPTVDSATYYIGVSGYGNSAYAPDGYDPMLGIPGTAGIAQPGGPFAFDLNVSAQPHDMATQLVDFGLNHADSSDPSPTSMTLTFSGPIDVNSLFAPDQQETALSVVDSSGKVWPVTALDYQSADAQLTLVFDAPLPAGKYFLVVPTTGGLTDLGGEPVVAPDGNEGILATWTVSSATAPRNPNDLGVLWPAKAGVVWPASDNSFSAATPLAPGQSETFRWVVIVPGFYKLDTQASASAIQITNTGNGTTRTIVTGNPGETDDALMELSAGVYELTMTNAGAAPSVLQWVLKVQGLDWEKIIGNGVSQSNALNLGTFSPPISGAETVTITGLRSITPLSAGDLQSATLGPVPASLFVTLNTSLTGAPTWDGQPIGPAVGGADGVVASSGPAIGQSLLTGIRSMLSSDSEPIDEGDPALIEHSRTENASTEPPGTRVAGATAARPSPDLTSTRADALALAQSEWLGRLGSLVEGWFAAARSEIAAADPPIETRAQPALVANPAIPLPDSQSDAWRNRFHIPTSTGDIGTAARMIVVCAAVYQLRRPFKNWWHERVQLAATRRRSSPRVLPAHLPIARASRISTRVRINK